MSIIATDHAPLLERAFARTPAEHRDSPVDIRGEIPSFVRGTLYQNGPAKFERNGVIYDHWLDGDGMVSALRFEDRGVSFSNRFVRTTRWTAEEEGGRPLFRRVGTRLAGGQLHRGVMLESAANVSVVPFGRGLLACGEQGLPWHVDARSLETSGACTFKGALTSVSPFSAHPHIDARTGELFNFGVSFHPRQPWLFVYRFTRQGELVYRRRLPLEHPCSVHDFALSERFAVFYVSPYLLDGGALRDGATVVESLRWVPHLGSRILLVDRATGGAVGSVAIEGRYCLHLVNAFERDGQLYVDVLELNSPVYGQYMLADLFAEVDFGCPARFIIDLASVSVRARECIQYFRAPDFPVIPAGLASRPYKWFAMLGMSAAGQPGRKFFDELIVAEWGPAHEPRVLRLAPGQYFAGEPAIVSDSGSTAAVLVCPIFDAVCDATRFVVVDPQNLSAGPVAELTLVDAMPPAFHGVFCPSDNGCELCSAR